MKKVVFLCSLLACASSASATLTLQDICTVSDRGLVVIFASQEVVPTDCNQWISSLPRVRQWVDHLYTYGFNEFTVHETLTYPAVVYPVLAQGGTWDETRDPFAVQTRRQNP